MTDIPSRVKELVETFERHIETYHSQQYNETQLRREFIDPFFTELGWDVTNIKGYAQAYKDVIHEDAIKCGGATKAPDYCFRIGGVRKFFLEAKKPSVDIKGDPHPAYQLRRYAWSAKLPLSILTDFEEFAVYDCQIRPKHIDKAETARIMYFTYEDYLDNWTAIADVFGRESILKGSFDKFAASTKSKRGTTTVDIEFLKEIDKWREMLAKIIALRNRQLSTHEINFAVQRTIDRVLFLRMCEDRGIEDYGQLLKISTGERAYPRLCEIFERADQRYNSGLFHFHDEKDRHEAPDTLTPNIIIDDKDLKWILHNLYFPQSPYEFSVLPAEILGNVYEQFLGKVIRLTTAHQAKVEDKPEVKKAGGVYYTPSYIVDYIVKNTIGKLIEGKTPRQIANLRILDPACGSGSFLLGAYTFLLDYYRDWYVANDPQKHTKKIYQGKAGQWFLTIAEKKKILLNNIYGVDIDSQAVEVTKLSLLLKVLEGEDAQTIENQYRLFHERALPDLADNIKCGNSLISPDFYENLVPDSITDDLRDKINAFDWQAEFPQIFSGKNPGFDNVIGNPPYIRVRIFRDLYPEQADYLESHYKCATHVWDIYLLMFEKALELTKHEGRFSFIVPVQTLHQPNCTSLRQLLINNTSIRAVVDLSRLKIFQNAIVKNCILVCEKSPGKDNNIEVLRPDSILEIFHTSNKTWPQKFVKSNPSQSLKVELLSPLKKLCNKLSSKSKEFGEFYYVTFGIRSCAKIKGGGGKDRLITTNKGDINAKLYMEGREIGRYCMAPQRRYIMYLPDKMYSPRSPELFETEKIISQTMLSKMRLVATYDNEHYYVEQSLLCIIPHGILTPNIGSVPPLKFALGILNSTLESFYFRTNVIDYSLGGGLIHATPGSQKKLLLPIASSKDIKRMISLVDRMLDLHKKLAAAKIPDDKTKIQRQIDTTDKQIDKLVYKLYGLTEDEIKIVEESM